MEQPLTQILEEGAKDAPVKDVLWNATQAQTETVPILDPGVGREVVLRHFFFKAQPLPKGIPMPTKVELISHYKRLIEMSLWGDGLIIREDKSIELHTLKKVKAISKSLYQKMKKEGSDFCILVLAEARAGVSVREQAFKA